MSEVRRILSTSFISLLLMIWGLFMVCSGRVPTVAYDDEFADPESGYSESENSDLMTQLAFLDERPTKLEDFQRREILEALGIDPSGADMSAGEQDFLSEELFLDLEVEIAELEKLSGSRNSMLDSLRLEMQEADHQLAALSNLVDVPKGSNFNFASTNQTAPRLKSNSEYAQYYQDALDDVYGKRFDQAIVKFQELLRQSDSDNLADNAQYWIAECNYALGNYQVAIAEFERVFAFENNNKTDDAQFMIGIAYLKAGDPRLAQLELSNLLAFYQDSEYVARAEREFLGLNI
ncbi:tetratricopeptide repeat protein [candidate division KSB1 bacterium]|nr:tetratricopeptide repeat protein [candidate division KSB1 bacterium]